MKKLFTLFAVLAIFAVVGCEENGGDDINPNDKTEQSGEQTDVPENLFFGLDKESVSISPDGGSVDVIVYSNYKWEISGKSDWCTPSVTSGEANEDGQKVTFSAEVAYDSREAIFWFRCADEKIKFTVTQTQKDVIIAGEDNTFNVPAEGGLVSIAYQTTVGCEIIIPEEAKDWILFAETRALVGESATLNVLENTTYSARSAVIKVVAVDNESLVVEYTINQVQNDAIIADENNTFHLPYTGGSVKIDYQTNVECEVVIPEEAQSWISLAPQTRALVKESATLDIAENTSYSARTAVVKVVAKENEGLVAEYTINQEQNNTIIAVGNNTFNAPAEGGIVTIAYQTSVDCEVIIPYNAQSWISIVPTETRGVASGSATLNVAENTTYNNRSAIVKVAKVGNNSICAEYTINQEQNDAIIVNGNNFLKIGGFEQSVNLTYKTNVECEVVIPEEAKEWITLAPATRALVQESTTLNIAENNTGAERSAVVKVVDIANSKLLAEYTITQNQRYFIEYTSSDGGVVTPNNSGAFGANIIRNKYIDGKGYIDFDAPVTLIGDYAFSYRTSLASITIPDSVTSIGDDAFYGCSNLKDVYIADIRKVQLFAGTYILSNGANLWLNGKLVTEYTFPNGITNVDNRLLGCISITKVTIPDYATSIGSSAFSNCSSLTSINIPDSVTLIGGYAFSGCSSIENFTIPDSVTEIGDWAFKDCTGELVINCKIIEQDYNFYNYPSKYGWSYGSNFTNLVIGDNVTKIGNIALGCLNITNIFIPDSVTSIGYCAFIGCSDLVSVTIGKGVTSIGSGAFQDCTGLTSIYCKPTTPPAGDVDMFYNNNASGRKIYVPTNSVSKYKKASYWSNYADDIVGYDF